MQLTSALNKVLFWMSQALHHFIFPRELRKCCPVNSQDTKILGTKVYTYNFIQSNWFSSSQSIPCTVLSSSKRSLTGRFLEVYLSQYPLSDALFHG